MYGGFRYCGKHSYEEYGLIVRTVNRPLLAGQKTVQQDKAFDDGKADYTAVNLRDRALFDNKTITVECKFGTPAGFEELQRRTARISAWLSNVRGGFSPLIFDDMPMIAWQVKPTNNIPVEFQFAAAGSFQITFECEPFNSYIFDSSNIPLDADIPLDSEFQLGGAVPLDREAHVTWYSTSAPCRPVLLIKGMGDSITIACNGCTLAYGKPWSGELTVDCASMKLWLNGNLLEGVTGSYFEFFGGDNVVDIIAPSAGMAPKGTVEAVYPYNVFYGAEN